MPSPDPVTPDPVSSDPVTWRDLFAAAQEIPEEKLRWWLSDRLDLPLTALPFSANPASEDQTAFERAVVRLRSGEPVQYICGRAPFRHLLLQVSPAVLIPRPETEQLVQIALDQVLQPGDRVLDVGTGSGCIACSLKQERPDLTVEATDFSEAALAVARQNANRLGLDITFRQADLLQAMYGRNGEAPIPVVAAKSPADCFDTALEAARIALQFNTPVMVLSDGYLANGAEPWRIPDPSAIPKIEVRYGSDPDTYHPYKRNPETLARLMALPGTPGLEHRIGGLEKEDISGHVSYEPENHDRMVRLRAEKIERVAGFVGAEEVDGPAQGDLLVISWGSTFGSVYNAIHEARRMHPSSKISWIHLRWLNPLSPTLGRVIHNFKNVLVPEINLGQLRSIIRDRFLVDAKGFNKVRGLPFKNSELTEAMNALL